MEVARLLKDTTKKEAVEDFEKLKDLDCSKITNFSRVGLNCLDYFFLHHRIKAKTRRHISFYEATKDKTIMNYINDKSRKVRQKNFSKLTRKEKVRARYNLFQLYYGSINQFRPSEAKRLYCRLEPKVGILDFSAGWGGRCLAAIAYGVPYIGIDANKNMKGSYNQMIKAIGKGADVTMTFQPSETIDFSNYKYDLIFTSPPYFMIEEYEKMPAYGSKEGFLEKFFRPVVTNAWKHLQSPGYMALNMPKEMYDAVKDLLPPLHKRYRLPVMSRHPTNAAKRRQIGETEKGARSEGIYVWKKSS
jgi:tRNA1(Val) A37 N6-methylase TrmN6